MTLSDGGAVYWQIVRYLFLSVALLALFPRGVVGQEAAEESNQAEAAPRAQSSAEMTQREIDRRREATFRLNENLDLAERLYQAGEWEHAQAKFRLVMNQTDPQTCLLYTSPSPRDRTRSRMPSSA